MFEWEKLGQVFDPTKLPGDHWIKEYAQAPSVVPFEKNVRVFFSSRPSPDATGKYISRMAYIDLDRNNLRDVIRVAPEPILSLGETGTFDEFGTYPVSVVRHGDELRAYYAGWTRCESVPFNAAIGVATSRNNGDSFERIGKGPVLAYTPDEPFVLGSPKIRHFGGTWYLWYSCGVKWVRTSGRPEPVYKIRMATSPDGLRWTKQHRALLPDVLEPDECQAGADVFEHGGRFHMFYSYRYNVDFRAPGRGYRIGYATSSDLLHWTREDARAGITASAEGWDSESVSYPHVFALDGQIYMLYQGNQIGRIGFGLARLRRGMPGAGGAR